MVLYIPSWFWNWISYKTTYSLDQSVLFFIVCKKKNAFRPTCFFHPKLLVTLRYTIIEWIHFFMHHKYMYSQTTVIMACDKCCINLLFVDQATGHESYNWIYRGGTYRDIGGWYGDRNRWKVCIVCVYVFISTYSVRH